MAKIEAKNPDGSIADVVEVDMEESGLGVVLTDREGDRIFIHRLAWNGVALAVKLMLETEKETLSNLEEEGWPETSPIDWEYVNRRLKERKNE